MQKAESMVQIAPFKIFLPLFFLECHQQGFLFPYLYSPSTSFPAHSTTPLSLSLSPLIPLRSLPRSPRRRRRRITADSTPQISDSVPGMKLKINKACDLNSISVLPPHCRKSSGLGPASSVLGGGNGSSQIKSQPSQQSFSQGVSSQHGMFSQLSQNSLNEVITNDQRFCSQERDNSVKNIACPPPVSYTREESQMPVSLTSSNFMRKWTSTSAPEHKRQTNEDLDHRIATIEMALGRFGITLDSVQSDVMQISKGTKGISLELESLRQKLMVHEDSIHVLSRGQEDIRTSLDLGFKSVREQLGKNANQDKWQEALSAVLAFPDRMEACLQKQKNEIWRFFSSELQACFSSYFALASNLKSSNLSHLPPAVLPPKLQVDPQSSSQLPLDRRSPAPVIIVPEALLVPNIEAGRWTCVKPERADYLNRNDSKAQKQRRVSSIQQDGELRGLIDLDEDLDASLSCLIVEKETDSHLTDEAKRETERILRKARRRKRKLCDTIIIN
ncbi:putative recombination initiation defects 3 [Drosera capensis]